MTEMSDSRLAAARRDHRRHRRAWPCVYLSLVGLVEAFADRDVITGLLTLGS